MELVRPTARKDRTDYEIRTLGPADYPSVHALYAGVMDRTPKGFLALRTCEQFQEALSTPDRTVAVGGYYQGKLIAYSICRMAADNPYPECAFMATIDPRTPIYVGMGTVVDPAHEGRLLVRLLSLRIKLLRERGIVNVAGLVAVDNIASIARILRASGYLVGLTPDATGMNFIAYSGEALRQRPHGEYTRVALNAQSRQEELFAIRQVAFELTSRSSGQRELTFSPIRDTRFGR
jgi:hypothetical protein